MVKRSDPFLSATEFAAVCETLVEECEAYEAPAFRATVRQEHGQTVLNISRTLAPYLESAHDGDGIEEEVLEVQEDPDEAQVTLSKPAAAEGISVDFRILLSPTYGVPVLYFRFTDRPASSLQDLDQVYERLVPNTAKSSLDAVGVMGAISFTNDPVTDMPCFFVHPCRTADALRAVLPAEEVSPLQYLLVWFGLIGPAVNLHLPKELAMALGQTLANPHRCQP